MGRFDFNGKTKYQIFFTWIFEKIFGESKSPLETEIYSGISLSPENDLISNQEISAVSPTLAPTKNAVNIKNN